MLVLLSLILAIEAHHVDTHRDGLTTHRNRKIETLPTRPWETPDVSSMRRPVDAILKRHKHRLAADQPSVTYFVQWNGSVFDAFQLNECLNLHGTFVTYATSTATALTRSTFRSAGCRDVLETSTLTVTEDQLVSELPEHIAQSITDLPSLCPTSKEFVPTRFYSGACRDRKRFVLNETSGSLQLQTFADDACQQPAQVESSVPCGCRSTTNDTAELVLCGTDLPGYFVERQGLKLQGLELNRCLNMYGIYTKYTTRDFVTITKTTFNNEQCQNGKPTTTELSASQEILAALPPHVAAELVDLSEGCPGVYDYIPIVFYPAACQVDGAGARQFVLDARGHQVVLSTFDEPACVGAATDTQAIPCDCYKQETGSRYNKLICDIHDESVSSGALAAALLAALMVVVFIR